MVGIDSALLMNPKVWEASGHLNEFSDPLVECKNCHERFRADQIDVSGSCPSCGTRSNFTEAVQFNLMLKTFLGPAEEKANVVYFRPETAQGMFVNFKNVLETTRRRLPFGIAQIGKAFRNEVTPSNFIFRMREFEQMEIEYFVRESEWKKWFEHWLLEMKRWLNDLGIREKMVEFVDIPQGMRAHYSKRTVDIEYKYPFGQKELYGLAYRGDFDLKNHMRASGIDLRYTDSRTKEKFLPHCVEPTWGVDRSVLVAMLEAYSEEEVEGETRIVMKFPKWLAPLKVAVLPLSKKDELTSLAYEIYLDVRKYFMCDYDETQSIGRRYRRQDEIGTPYCVTVDFETKEDKKVTVRDRDTMKQDRVAIAELIDYLKEKLAE
jgi:glycyl-tRNA synthetase